MTSKFLLDEDKVIEQYNKVNEYCDKVSYSLKTNFEVGNVLEEKTNCSFSVHTIESVKEIKDKDRIWYFSQGWSKDKISELISLGVNSFVVDNQADLDEIIRFVEENDVSISLLLRKRLKEHSVSTGKRFVFGFYSEQVNEKIRELNKIDGIQCLGIHFHRKTQNVSEWDLKEELKKGLDEEIFDIVDVINIGGGLPSVYKNYNEDIIDGIFDKIKDLYEWLNKAGIEMISEPGRYIAAPSIKLVTQVKNVYDGNVIVDSSVYNSAMDTFISHIRLLVEDEVSEEEGEPYTIKGCTPDPLDIFRYKVYFSEKPEKGDKIVFKNAGAYNFSTDFCKLPTIETEKT